MSRETKHKPKRTKEQETELHCSRWGATNQRDTLSPAGSLPPSGVETRKIAGM